MKLISIFIVFLTCSFGQEQMYQFNDIKNLNSVYKKYLYRSFIAYEKLSKSPTDKLVIKNAFQSFQKLYPSKMSKNEQLAFWINLYNITVINTVIDNYPIKTINDIPNVFKKDLVTVEGKTYSLDALEKENLKSMGDPRYHFAIVCAAISCPNILAELYEGNRINYQLETVTHDFINDKRKNELSSKVVKLSKLFEWYNEEFEIKGGIKTFINQYLPFEKRLQEKRTIIFQEFDWRLNGEITARKMNNSN